MHIVMAMEFEILNHTESVRRISWRVDCEKGKDRHASKFDTEISTSHQNIKEFLPVIKVCSLRVHDVKPLSRKLNVGSSMTLCQ